MAGFSHPNILKLGKSKLDVNVRQTRSTEHHPPCPCPSHCSSPPLHITFYTHSKHRFLDPRHVSLSSSLSSDSSALIAEHQQIVGETTICQDGSLFFNLQEKANSRVAVKAALRSLKVKKSRHGRIIKDVMTFGRRYNKVNREKEVLKGLAVTITVEQSFIGDREAVHEVMEKSWEDIKSQARGDGDILLVN